ncbi:hypothetical protein [uncultured Microscilla sp.]|nr:hypothetical protein [uncultured Microscilla sp.]
MKTQAMAEEGYSVIIVWVAYEDTSNGVRATSKPIQMPFVGQFFMVALA